MLRINTQITRMDDRMIASLLHQLIKNRFQATLLEIIPNKTELLLWILNHFRVRVLEYLSSILIKYRVIANIMNISATKNGSVKGMIKLEVVIDEVDYVKTVEGLLPILLEHLSKQEEPAKLTGILLELGELPAQVMSGAIMAIPPEVRDVILAKFLNEYREEISEALTALLVQNRIKAEITSIKLDAR